jgi:hypothetical protein
MTKRGRIVGYGAAAVLVVAGGLSAALAGGGVGQALAMVLIGLGLVLAVSLVFYEVGLSEDRERARERDAARRREEARQRQAARERSGQTQSGRPRRRLERMRGRPRRLR